MNHFRTTIILLSITVLLVVGFGVSQAQEPAANIAGKWTIYAQNVDHPGSSLKTVQIAQNGNIITGKFKGPHQSGKIQGWINQDHVEFSTDTREVLTFRGRFDGTNMSGLYGVHGRHAPWNAERISQ